MTKNNNEWTIKDYSIVLVFRQSKRPPQYPSHFQKFGLFRTLDAKGMFYSFNSINFATLMRPTKSYIIWVASDLTPVKWPRIFLDHFLDHEVSWAIKLFAIVFILYHHLTSHRGTNQLTRGSVCHYSLIIQIYCLTSTDCFYQTFLFSRMYRYNPAE